MSRNFVSFFIILLKVKTVFTAAPAVPDLEPEFFSLSDVFCVNETEVRFKNGKMQFLVFKSLILS